MKNLFLSLALIGLTSLAANAQSSAHSKFAKNYPICNVGGTYQVCQVGSDNSNLGRTVDGDAAYLSMENTYVHMGNRTSSGNARFRTSRIRVTYDEPGAAYEGKESMINDGVRKNETRNINYLDTANPVPPNDGGLSNR